MADVLFVEAEPFPLEQFLPASLTVRRGDFEEVAATTPRAALVVLALPREECRADAAVHKIAIDRPSAPLFLLVPEGPLSTHVPNWLSVAEDFALLPVPECELRERLARLLAAGVSSQQPASALERLQAEHGLRQLVGQNPKFLTTLEQIPRLAQSDATVLIQGDSGTGKELVARALHHLSRRRGLSFIAVDCGAFPDHLIENELFGHAPGAYTDARSPQKGLAALAAGGTLFLDEIDALTLQAQAKMLRFVQERTFKPLGSDRFEKVDIKIVAATNRDLARLVRDGRFREDLYYRLHVLSLRLAPLRERSSDIPLLTRHFLQTLDPRGITCSPAALRMLTQYDWPGNVRELQNVVQRALVMCDGAQIQGHHLKFVNDEALEEPGEVGAFRSARATALATFERRYLTALLQKHHGNITRAARDAGKDRRALGRLIKKHRLQLQAG
jgi:two-component system, NtrC family, response regulator GlrR